MSDLLKKPFGKRGKVHQITPESAGWRYVGFSLYHLKAGDKAAEATGDREVILVLVEGKAHPERIGGDDLCSDESDSSPDKFATVCYQLYRRLR